MNNLDHDRDILGNSGSETVGGKIKGVGGCSTTYCCRTGCARKWLSDMKLSRVHPVLARVRDGILEPSCRIKELVTTQSEWIALSRRLRPEIRLIRSCNSNSRPIPSVTTKSS